MTLPKVDAGIDTGPVLARGDVPIERRSTLAETLAATIPRLHAASLDALEAVLSAAAFTGEPQPAGGHHRTTPTLGDYLHVRKSLRD